MKRSDKRAIQLAIHTIILIVLGLAVLIGLLYLFVTETSFFKEVIKDTRSDSNVDLIVTKCNSLVETGGVYSYCCDGIEVRRGDWIQELTCEGLRNQEFGKDVQRMDCDWVVCE